MNSSTGAEVAALGRALELAAFTAERPIGAEEADRAIAQAGRRRGEAAGWDELVAGAAHTLALQPHLRAGSAAEFLADARSVPALTRLRPGRWLVVHGRRGRRLRTTVLDARGEKTRLLTARQVDRLCEADERRWICLEPLLALDPISVSQDPRLEHAPWVRLRAFMRLERRELWVVLVYAVVIGAMTLATPIAVQALVNTIAFGAVLQPLVVLSLLLLAGLSFAGVLRLLEAWVVEVLQRRIFVRVAEDFGRRLPSIRADEHDRHYLPEVANRFFEVISLQKASASLLLDGLALVLQTAIGMVLLAFYHPLLLAFDVILVVLLAGVVWLGRGAVVTGVAESRAKYRAAAWLQDVARLPGLFRGAASAQHAANRIQSMSRDYLTARKAHFRILVRQIAGGLGMQVFATVALLGVGGWLVIARQLTLGQLVASELVIAAVAAGFAKMGKHLEMTYDLAVGVEKLGRVVDLPCERRGGETLDATGPAMFFLRDAVVSRGGKSLLTVPSLEIAARERLAVVGPSGSGKSTLLAAMAGERPLSHGTIQVDRLDLRRADLGLVRDQVLVVRGVELIEGSILDNLRLGAPDLTEPGARALLQLLELETVVDALPDGLDTPVMPSGAPLSETQARRLVLARALAARPRALLLDGALDRLGLSPHGRAEVLDAVLGSDAAWTAVVVSEEPEVLQRCDRTVRIQDQIVMVVQ